jgi:hypothetical protein
VSIWFCNLQQFPRDFMSLSRFFPSMLLAALFACLGNDGNAQPSDFNTPFGADLVESFELIALRNEYGETAKSPDLARFSGRATVAFESF